MEKPFENRADEALAGEELHYVSDATTENFNKIFLHLAKWVNKISDYIMKKKGFRLVVEYKPEAEITEVSFYDEKSTECVGERRNLEFED